VIGILLFNFRFYTTGGSTVKQYFTTSVTFFYHQIIDNNDVSVAQLAFVIYFFLANGATAIFLKTFEKVTHLVSINTHYCSVNGYFTEMVSAVAILPIFLLRWHKRLGKDKNAYPALSIYIFAENKKRGLIFD
jgi:hypothetical protein